MSKKKPTFSWEQREADIDAMLRYSYSSTIKLATNGTVTNDADKAAYTLSTVDDKALTIYRNTTASTVRITRKMVEKTAERLIAGEKIPKREISYTVAIEAGVVFMLNGLVREEDGHYVLNK